MSKWLLIARNKLNSTYSPTLGNNCTIKLLEKDNISNIFSSKVSRQKCDFLNKVKKRDESQISAESRLNPGQRSASCAWTSGTG